MILPRQPDFFRSLNVDLLEQLEEYARQPGRDGSEVLDWLTAQGVKTSRSAVYRWLQDFRLEDRTRRASEVARQYLSVARDADPNAVATASVQKFEELVFDFLVNSDGADAGELMRIAMAMKSGVGTRREIEDLKRRQADAVKEAEKQATTGASAGDVVATIKKALGIAA